MHNPSNRPPNLVPPRWYDIKIVIASDAPQFDTGFGLQTRYLAWGLYTLGHTVETVSLPPIPPDQVSHGFPFRVHTKTGWEGVLDYGPEWTLITLTDDYKVLNALHQRPRVRQWFRWVAYDGDVMPLSWIGLNALSTPVLVSPWGRTMLQSRFPQMEVPYIPHGVDTAFWHSPSPAEREAAQRRVFSQEKPDFVVGYVGRGHPRKNIPVWFWIAGELLKHHPTTRFLLRMPPQDGAGQYDWMEFVDRFNLWGKLQWIVSPSQERGVEPEFLRDIYWACDVLVHPAMSEGFGLTPIESRLCGTPALVGAYSAMRDWASPLEQVPIATWSWEAESIKQARVDARAMVRRVEKLMNPTVRAKVAQQAYKQVEGLTIDRMVQAWHTRLTQDSAGESSLPWIDLRTIDWGVVH